MRTIAYERDMNNPTSKANLMDALVKALNERRKELKNK
jgi:hypothetical protein